MSLEDDKRPILVEDLGMFYPTEKSKEKKRFGLYKCGYCGKEFRAQISRVKGNYTRSCGCLVGKSSILHGVHDHKLYSTWNNMQQRCYNLKNKNYVSYGGSGIEVCEEWKDVKNFVAWAEATHPNIEGYTLDRIDVNGNYEPDNCRWASKTTQTLNQRMRKDNSTGFVGIVLDKISLRWKATVHFKYKTTYLGTFKTVEEAVHARDTYILENNLPHKLSTEYNFRE